MRVSDFRELVFCDFMAQVAPGYQAGYQQPAYVAVETQPLLAPAPAAYVSIQEPPPPPKKNRIPLYITSAITLVALIVFFILLAVVQTHYTGCLFNFDVDKCESAVNMTYVMITFLCIAGLSSCFCFCLVCGYAFS
jgi:hypothetical protein